MIGGEGPATASWMVASHWIEYVQQYGALCFQLGHRFHGQSRPTADMSVENVQYLSSEQELADIASFSAAMTEKHALPEGTKVQMGGVRRLVPGHPGTAWYRLKYLHMVHARSVHQRAAARQNRLPGSVPGGVARGPPGAALCLHRGGVYAAI
ncbi:putative serine protease F56F10.1 [Amphibalanus amphitrite]|uniref:Putative serine protease F56F10.1 n=1 Tax=Amphibalanus amphitrite TaxID=1232801 RepID=A0A6A4VZE6_AMPAM|nr:putative serine protease F56F10.1 [Amphibalanus amphitrite]